MIMLTFIGNPSCIAILNKLQIRRLKEIAGYNVNFDEDILEFTDKQLSMFKPINPQYYKITPKKKAIR